MAKLFPTIIILCFQCLPAHAQWKKISSGTTEDLYDIHVVGPIIYIAGQNSTLLKSTDSARTWKSVALTIPCHLRTLYFIDSSVGFVSGENARIQKTTDGGKNWSQKYIRTAAYLYDIQFMNSSGIGVGKDMLAIRSGDLGETWQVDTTFNSKQRLNSLCILPSGMCWAVGDSGYIIRKYISEKKWEIVKYPGKINLNHISSFGDSVLIITGGMPDSAQVGVHHNIFLRSLDSGKTWTSTAIHEMKTIYTAWFRNMDTGFLAGSNGIVSKCYQPFSKRGQQLSGTASSLNKIFFHRGVGLVAGDGGTILRTTNDGGFGLDIPVVPIASSVQVYPNPCNGDFDVSANEKILAVRVYDIFGRLVSENRSPDSRQFHIGSKGLFTVCMELADGHICIQKLIVN